MPFILAVGFVYFVAGGLGMAPTSWNCNFDHVKTVSALNVDFDISTAECFYGPFSSETPTVVWASQRGDRSRTKIYQYGGIVDVRIAAMDERTVRISIPEKFGDQDRLLDVHYVSAQRSRWRGISFVYDLAGADLP
jgi:hypothetical protein